MSYLAYAITRAPEMTTESMIGDPITGVQGQPVESVTARGFAAAVSRITGPEPPLSIDQLKIYQQVIETLFVKQTLIPLRYGAVFKTKAGVEQMLESSGTVWLDRLETIRGCVEIGIRVIPAGDPKEERTHDTPAAENTIPPGQAAVSHRTNRLNRSNGLNGLNGTAYLRSRREHYQQADRQVEDTDRVIERCTRPFQSLAKEWRWEKKKGTAASLGIYFLVPRERVEAFKHLYRKTAPDIPGKSCLSGPWPPYNFVSPESEPGAGPMLRRLSGCLAPP